jgi:hypothetical protein
MSSKNTTTTSNQYNPNAMQAYNTFQPQLQTSLMQMAQNPLGSSYFQHQLSQQQATAHQVNQRSQTNMLQNMRTGGGILSNSGGFMNAALNRNMIAGSGMQSNAFNSALNQALSNRNAALSSMQGYQPLQTGQTSVSGKSGAGTWVGPALGVVGGVAGAMVGGPAGAMAGAKLGSSLGGSLTGGNNSTSPAPAYGGAPLPNSWSGMTNSSSGTNGQYNLGALTANPYSGY